MFLIFIMTIIDYKLNTIIYTLSLSINKVDNLMTHNIYVA